MEAGFGLGLIGLEVLEIGVGYLLLIIEVLEPERSDVADGVDVDLAV
jgi:hypothetical protein